MRNDSIDSFNGKPSEKYSNTEPTSEERQSSARTASTDSQAKQTTWSAIRQKFGKAAPPDWVWSLPRVLEKLQDELSMKKGSLSEEIWQDAHDPDVHPEILRLATVRVSAELCDEEKAFLRRRKANLVPALARYLDLREDEINEADVPTIGMCGSGGGLRALVAGASSFYSTQRVGLFDCVTYTAGVSGSCWLQTLYYSSITGQKFDILLEHLKKRLGTHIAYPPVVLDLVTSAPTNKYLLSGGLEKYQGQADADFGLVDIYGLLLGARLLVPRSELVVNDKDFKLSNQAEYLRDGAHPLPLYSAVRHEVPDEKKQTGERKKPENAADDIQSKSYFQWFEFTPFELFCEELEAGIPTWSIGRPFRNGISQWRENGLALPELRTPLLMGIWGSAFCASLYHFYNEVKPVLKGLTGFDAIDKLVTQSSEELLALHPIPPPQIPNFLLGLQASLPASCPQSIHSTPKLALMDAGISNNLPIYPLLRPGRNVDILIAFDASADVRKDNWLRKADEYAEQRGIAGWPAGSGWPEEEQAPAAGLADASQDDSPPGSTDLGPCTVFVGSPSTSESASKQSHQNGREAHRSRQSFAEEIARHETGLVVVYFPLIPHADIPGLDPRKTEFLSTWNFVYTPEQIDKVVALAKRNFDEGAEATREAIRAVYERKKKQRLAKEKQRAAERNS